MPDSLGLLCLLVSRHGGADASVGERSGLALLGDLGPGLRQRTGPLFRPVARALQVLGLPFSHDEGACPIPADGPPRVAASRPSTAQDSLSTHFYNPEGNPSRSSPLFW